MVAGAILRLIALGRKSFWLDEIASVAISRRPWPVFWHFLWHDEGNMALYYVLLKPWLHFGYAESAVRLLSVLAGVASIPLMYSLGARLFGRSTGLLSAALLAVNACAIAVSQEARAYSFLVLFVLLSTYLFVRLVEMPSRPWGLAYAVVAGISCYFHYFGVLVPAAHAVTVPSLPCGRRPYRLLLLAWAIIVVMAAPILWLMHAQDVGHLTWVQRPSWLELYHLGVFLASDGGKAVGGVLLGIELLLAVSFLASMRSLWRPPDGLLRWRYALVVSAILTPVVITLLVSIIRPAFYHRFLIIVLPGWLMMIAIALLRLPIRAWRVAAIVVVCSLSLATTVLLYRRPSEDWRGAVTYLAANSRPDDRVLYYQSVGEFAGESYRDWLAPANAPRPQAIGIDAANVHWQADLDHVPRIWLVLYREKPNDVEALAVQRALSDHYAAIREQDFYGISVIQYGAR
jgi:mannosyltransferase